jgi:cyclic pyranopterin phosphate synthase
MSAVLEQEISRTYMTQDSLGRVLRDLRVSVTDLCNFRCRYCMPAHLYGEKYEFLSKENYLTFSEIERLVRLFVSLGVSKVRITGGEPLLRKNVAQLVDSISKINGVMDLALTTNGFLLSEYADSLKKAGLKRITVSLDSLNDEVFGSMNGLGLSNDRVLQGIEAAKKVGFKNIKINVVLLRGVNDSTLLDLVRYFRGTGMILRFIEYMDVGNKNGWKREEVVSSSEILKQISKEYPLEPLSKKYLGEVAERYRYKDGAGEIGFISSVTQPFCGACTRGRLSTDGQLFTCLFSGTGTDLKSPLREGASDEELLSRIQSVWKGRSDRYSEERFTHGPSRAHKIEMYQIGG